MICCTFDFDMYDYKNKSVIDEFELFGPELVKLAKQYKTVAFTWFIRIDDGIEKTFGDRLYVNKTHRKYIDEIQELGGSIGWHHHPSSTALSEKDWLTELQKNSVIAREENYRISRMGFGQMNTKAWKIISDHGFICDSSCISRPNYKWEKIPFRNWEDSPNRPFKPLPSNYAIESNSSCGTLQVPITTVPLSFESDNTANMRRYVSLSYSNDVFNAALKMWRLEKNLNNEILVLMTHPCDLFSEARYQEHDQRKIQNLHQNLETLIDVCGKFTTIDGLASSI